MNGKFEFGVDFLILCRALSSLDESTELELLSDAATRFLLLLWDFSSEEVDSTTDLYRTRFQNGELDDPLQASIRLMDQLSSNRNLQGQLVSHLSAIGGLDYSYSKGEQEFINSICADFGFSTDDYNEFTTKGKNLAIGIRFIAEYKTILGANKK